jgi:response regulator RpfG family c-di-GMP phosphodiesterase
VPKSVSAKVPPKKRENSSGGLREKSAPDGSQRLRVLIVEDDMINAQILTRRLKMDKHVVLTATNGQEAVDLLSKDWDVDLVLMDIQ